jgi:hypothetical protein
MATITATQPCGIASMAARAHEHHDVALGEQHRAPEILLQPRPQHEAEQRYDAMLKEQKLAA